MSIREKLYYLIEVIKFILLIVAIYFFVSGIINDTKDKVTIGCIFYLSSLLLSSVKILIESKAFKNNDSIIRRGNIELITKILEGLIMLFGIISLFIFEIEYLHSAGEII
jgi:hypothetical protein